MGYKVNNEGELELAEWPLKQTIGRLAKDEQESNRKALPSTIRPPRRKRTHHNVVLALPPLVVHFGDAMHICEGPAGREEHQKPRFGQLLSAVGGQRRGGRQ